MADVVEALGAAVRSPACLEPDRARVRAQPAGEDVEQGGFAGAVAAGDRPAPRRAREGERQPSKMRRPPRRAGEIVDG